MKKRRQLPFERSSNFAYAIDFRQSFARHDSQREKRKSLSLRAVRAALPTGYFPVIHRKVCICHLICNLDTARKALRSARRGPFRRCAI